MPVGPRLMPFTQHFVELRKRFTIIIVSILVLMFVFYTDTMYKSILGFILAPVLEYVPGGKLTVMGPFEALTFRFKVALFAAIVAASPIIIYNILAFMMPAFKKKERRWLYPTAAAGVGLFVGGAAFAYYVIMGPAFQWLSAQGGGVVNAIAAANQYLTGIGMMIIGFGLGFELPLVVFYLIGFGVVKFDWIVGAWRYALVGIMVIASIATPDWSPITMGGLFAALFGLYLASLLAARVVFAKKIKQQRIEDAEYQAMYADVEEPVDENAGLDLPEDFDSLSRKEQLIARAAAVRKKEKAEKERQARLKAEAEAALKEQEATLLEEEGGEW